MNLKEKAKKAFNEIPEYFQIMEEWHKNHGGIAVEQKVWELIENNIEPGSKVLDAGCGEGSIMIYFATRQPKVKFHGVDISSIGIKLAQEKSKNLDNVIWQQADLEEIPFTENFFDLIYCQSVLEMVEQ